MWRAEDNISVVPQKQYFLFFEIGPLIGLEFAKWTRLDWRILGIRLSLLLQSGNYKCVPPWVTFLCGVRHHIQNHVLVR